MFTAVRNYIYERRRGLATTAGLIGGCYLAGRYILERLEEIREQVVQEKTARENLRRRFQQNQQDCTYTVLALVPTLGERILEDMDVEGVTLTLQLQSRAAKTRLEHGSTISNVNTSSLSLNTEQPSVTSSIELSMPFAQGRGEDSAEARSPSLHLGESAQSWVDQFTQQSVGSSVVDDDEHPSPVAPRDKGSPTSSSGAHLSDSVTSASTSLITASDEERSGVMIDSMHSAPSESGGSQPGASVEHPIMTTKSKGELWREVKMLTFTRTLTILYSTTLLSLLTHIQLNLLGRHKYVQSVLELGREEKLREPRAFQASVSGLFWGSGDLEGALEELEHEDNGNALGLFGSGQTGGTERKYLTLSWWLIHVGWREIGDRVRRAVEDVLDGISLKTKLNREDLERLFNDVRRRIEFDDSPMSQNDVEDGNLVPATSSSRRISFLPSLIPPSPETLKDVLIQGGLPSHLTSLEDTAFLQLVSETRAYISSADFGRVLEGCLDHATDILFDGLRRTLFTDVDAPEDKIKLAGLLPGVARWSHSAVHGTPNELVEGLADVRELAGFSAIIYSSYEDTFR